MRRAHALVLALAVAACDTGPDFGSDHAFVYRTDGTDEAAGIAQAADGTLVVIGSIEGVPRPADGTLALPAVLRFGLDGALLSTEVYRDLGFGTASNVATTGSGLVLTALTGFDDPGGSVLRLLRADARGRRGEVLLAVPNGYSPSGAVAAFSDGSVVAAMEGGGTAPQVHRFGPDGRLEWAVRVDGMGGVSGLAAAPDGGVYVQGVGSGGAVLARLRPSDGAAVWRHVGASEWTPQAIAALPGGLAQLQARSSLEDGTAIRVVRFGAGGEARSTVQVARAPGAPGGERAGDRSVRPGTLTGLPDGRVAVAWLEVEGREPPDAFLAVVGDRVGRVRRFGAEGRWAWVSALTPLADGRVAAAGVIGPREVSGYGGDDLDVLVALYEVD